MKTTGTPLHTRRIVAVGAAVALTGMMLAADPADAGHRRHNRNHCCCGSSYNSHSGYSSGYGNSHQSGYGHTSGYGQTSSYGQGGYAAYPQNSGGMQYGTTNGQYGNAYSTQSEPQPNLANQQGIRQQGTQIRANRPITDGSVPPSPADADQAPDQTEQQANAQDGSSQNVEQMRQRIQSLEQENARLKNQLQEARQQGVNRTAADQQSSDRQINEADAADAEAAADREADTNNELPAPPSP